MELRPIMKEKLKIAEQLKYYDWCAVGWWQKSIIILAFVWCIYSFIKIFFIGGC